MRLLAAIGLVVAGPAVGGQARAQPAPAPVMAAGDSWTYEQTTEVEGKFRQTKEEITVDHAGPASVAVVIRTLGSNAPQQAVLTNPDWSRSRSVNGKQTVVNQPLDFPLRPGKAWSVEYTEANPNRQHASEHYRTPYKVTGWEDVTVAAGTFHALKIEAEGDWSVVMAPNVTAGALARVDQFGATTVTQANRNPATAASGRTYKAFWYVPAVKRWVRSVEEYYGAGGQRTASYKDELLSFRTAG